MARKPLAFDVWLKKNHPNLQVLGMHYDAEKKIHEVLLGCRVEVPASVRVGPEDEDAYAHADGERKHLLLPGIH